jgi:hypothetical protein
MAPEHVPDDLLAAEAAKDQREDGGAEQDDEDHAADLGRLLHHLAQDGHDRTGAGDGEQHGADGADRRRFGRGRDAAEDRAQDGDDQDGGRQEGGRTS